MEAPPEEREVLAETLESGSDTEDTIENASVNIARDFEAAVKEGFTFDGNFGFSTRYSMSAAANPCLNIDGLGTVGLPLSERDARAIISASVPVSGSMDGSQSSSGIWEMPAEKIHFDDPAWDAWIQKTAGLAACKSLHINSAPGQVSPTCTLRKLVIHEAGCQQTRFQDESGHSQGKIATLAIVLPGLFQGGRLQLRHGFESKSFDLAYQSGIQTSVVAAFLGLWYTLSSVTSGYRLSLVYDINQPSTDAGVRLPEMQLHAQKLRHILHSWKQNARRYEPEAAAPEFLACLLRHEYPIEDDKNFETESLNGADGQLVAYLIPLVRELGFRACFAHVTLTVTASASAERYANRNRGRYRYDTSESDDSIDEAEFDVSDEGEEEFRVNKVVDLSGMPIDVDIDLETCGLLHGSMTDNGPDDERFEKDDRTSGTDIKIYNRTILLLWLMNGDMEPEVKVGDISDYFYNALQYSDSAVPTVRERELVGMLAVCCKRRRCDKKKLQRVVEVLRESAGRWNDVHEFVRGLEACQVDKRTDLLGVEGFISAYREFGWDALKDFFGKAMENDESNSRRQALLVRLSKMAEEDNNSEIALWCKTQEENVLRFFSKLDAKQIPWLMELGLSRGAQFLRDIVFPQLHSQNLDKEFWIPFLRVLRESKTLVPIDVVGRLTAQCFSETARNLPPFPTKKQKGKYKWEPATEQKDCQPILDVIALLVESNYPELCSQVFIQMWDAARSGAYKENCPPWQYYVELSPPLIRLIQSSSATAPAILAVAFQPFFVGVVDSIISIPPTKPKIHLWEEDKPSIPQDMTTFRTATRMAGGLSMVKSSFLLDKLNRHSSQTLREMARAVAAEFRPQGGVAGPDYDVVIDALAAAAINVFDPTKNSPVSTRTVAYGYPNIGPPEQMLDLVKFCFEVGAHSQFQHLLDRLLLPPAGSTIEQHLSTALVPFFPALRQYLATKRLDFQTEPFKSFAVAVVTAFADKVMRQKHTDFVPAALQTIGCGCAGCSELKQFFLGNKPTIDIRDSQSTRAHLEGQIYNTKSFGISWETIKSGRPYALKIQKPAKMTPRGLWSANSKSGAILLATLGDETVQRSILGSEYESATALITGVKAAAPVPPANQALESNNELKRAAATTAMPSAIKKPRLS
ncbi:hypothetical protein C8R44DRAFT_346467 [Mycena epipterygia]|nr:hypothetical protein C8R44DRAFT_346467 [Mycena epipterygia]